MKMRSRLAVAFGAKTRCLIRRCRMGSGASLPGSLARRIDPNILQTLSGLVRDKIIAVTGTNGKTTTTALLSHVLRSQGKTVLTNQTGANMQNGVVSAFLPAAENRTSPIDYACIEIDEMDAPQIFSQLNPDCILFTNLSRDQLDRCGEIDTICQKLKEAAALSPKAALTVNCDDALLTALAFSASPSPFTYGISLPVFPEAARSLICENIFCPCCGEKLFYQLRHYGGLGLYRCPNCGFGRPEPKESDSQIHFHQGICDFELDCRPIRAQISSPYQIYNTLAAYAALKAVKAPLDGFAQAVKTFDYGNNRENVFLIHSTCVQLHLAKNPVSFQQKLALLQTDPHPKDILILINDNAPDGRDVSWLWDVDFGCLASVHAVTITAGGSRSRDMGLRLKYEDIPCSVIPKTEETAQAIKEKTLRGTGNLYIIVNYSNLYPTYSLLSRWQAHQKGENTL